MTFYQNKLLPENLKYGLLTSFDKQMKLIDVVTPFSLVKTFISLFLSKKIF